MKRHNPRSDWRPRLLVDITLEQHRSLQKFFEKNHGAKKRVFGVIVDDLIKALEKNPQAVIAGLLERYIHLQDFSPTIRNVVEEGEEEDEEYGHTRPSPRISWDAEEGEARSDFGDPEE